MTYNVEHCVTCDSCGKDGCHESSPDGVKRQMQEAGWVEQRVDIRLSSGQRARCHVHVCRRCAADPDAVNVAKETGVRRWARERRVDLPD